MPVRRAPDGDSEPSTTSNTIKPFVRFTERCHILVPLLRDPKGWRRKAGLVPLETVEPAKVRERQTDAGVESCDVMPPTDRQEECVPWFQGHGVPKYSSKVRVLIQIGLVCIDVAVNGSPIVNAM